MSMALLDSFEAGDGDRTPSTIGWLSPRISFSQDFVMLDCLSPEKRNRDQQQQDGFSSEFEFCSSVGVDLASMLAADELFFDGKVRFDRVMQEESSSRSRMEEVRLIEREESLRDDQHLRSFYDNPRCSSMIVEGARDLPLRSCISLTNSRYPSPSRSFSLSPTTPSSPKASSSKNIKFKEFLKLHLPRIRQLPSSEPPRDSSASSGRRMPITSKSFWPFSRSNSAGESKRSPAVSPPPRRSNSAGESKTSSSSLLPIIGNVAREAKANKPRSPQSSPGKKGSSPHSTSNAKKSSGNHSFLMHLNCSTHAVALSSQSASLSTPAFLYPSSTSTHGPSVNKGVHKCSSARAIDRQTDSVAPSNSSAGDHRTIPDSSFNTGRFRSYSSPGRPARRSTSIPARNFARSSPGRNCVRNGLGRAGTASKGLGRPLDILSREACKGSGPIAYNPSVTVMPVLNVPVCMGPSFRGAKTLSKSKNLNFGSFFPKREKVASGDSVLPLDSQSGA